MAIFQGVFRHIRWDISCPRDGLQRTVTRRKQCVRRLATRSSTVGQPAPRIRRQPQPLENRWSFLRHHTALAVGAPACRPVQVGHGQGDTGHGQGDTASSRSTRWMNASSGNRCTPSESRLQQIDGSQSHQRSGQRLPKGVNGISVTGTIPPAERERRSLEARVDWISRCQRIQCSARLTC